jgi:hypothetical protein
LSFGLWCRDQERQPDDAALKEYVASIGVPVRITADYAAFCHDVIAANLARRKRQRTASTWREYWRRIFSVGGVAGQKALRTGRRAETLPPPFSSADRNV